MRIFLSLFISLTCTLAISAQGKGRADKDIVVRACVQEIGNGLFRVNFGYDNPNRKTITLDEPNSFVRYNNGNKKTKGVNTFKYGVVNKAFTWEFHEKETVEWTVINPSGKIHTVTASANSAHCKDTDGGFIFPVYGQGNGKSNAIIGLELTALAEGTAGNNPSDIIYQIRGDQKVLIEIVPLNGKMPDAITILKNTFGLQYDLNPLNTDFIVNPDLLVPNNLSAIDVFFPINRLPELNAFTTVFNFIRVMYKPLQNKGVVTTEGDNAQKTDVVRESFRTLRNEEKVAIDGTGRKIGILSNSFNTQPFTGNSKAAVDVANGDLPGNGNPNGYDTPVDIINEYPYGISSDEGRAMLQTIHDVAPGANLAFTTGVLSPRDFVMGIQALANAGCTDILDDVTFPQGNMFGGGPISDAIRTFTQAPGKLYYTSAGNFSNKGYQGKFISSANLPVTNFIPAGSPARAHVFETNPDGSQVVLQKISVKKGIYMIVLQWDEGLASQNNSEGAASDLDIYVVNDNKELIVGNNRFNILGDSMEFIVFEAMQSGEANFMITSANGPPTPPGLSMRYVAYRYDGLDLGKYGGAPTITGHAMTSEAVTVAAVDFRTAQAQAPVVEAFSSHGGILANNYAVNIDFAAPDGGNTNVNSIGQDIDSDGFPNFFGTSASAPQAAAAVALLMSALPTWYPDGLPGDVPVQTNINADKGLKLFKNTALPSGPVEMAGAGFIDAAAAFMSIAAQTAVLTDLVVEDGKTPGEEPFEVTIIGKYFPDNPSVLLGDTELEIISNSETEIKARVGTFTSNDPLVVNTASRTPGGTDGGNSNPLFFYDEDVLFLNIIATDVSIEFGQEVIFKYTVEGLPDGVSFESLGLPKIKVTSTAFFPYPDVNNYAITPAFEEPLTEEQRSDYFINLTNGLLKVTRKDLLINPVPKAPPYKYGQPVILEMEYTYNTSGIADNNDFLTTIKNAHQSTFYPENTLAIINGFKPLVNTNILNLLEGGSFISSERTILNGFKPLVNGMDVIELNTTHFTDYIAEKDNGTTNGFKALVNNFKALVNTKDLFDGLVAFENGFKPLVNSSSLGGENDEAEYGSVFAVVHEDDGPTETEDRTIAKFYSINVITGLDATLTEAEFHHVYPGAFLAPIAANFNISYSPGILEIAKANLEVETNDIVINKDDLFNMDAIESQISGYEYDDTTATVFPDGIPYYFVDAQGNEYSPGDLGAFLIRIREPQNYSISYLNQGMLYINPPAKTSRKIRTYLDCVEEVPNHPNGLYFKAHFRYENPNSATIYVLHGTDNQLSGTARYSGETPIAFLPGQGKFTIPFDGNQLKWSLTTFDSAHKTSTSSMASSGSGRCKAGEIENGTTGSYILYPNPVQNSLNIQRNVSDDSIVELFDIYGSLYFATQWKSGGPTMVDIDMSAYPVGIYFIRINAQNSVKMFSIVKE